MGSRCFNSAEYKHGLIDFRGVILSHLPETLNITKEQNLIKNKEQFRSFLESFRKSKDTDDIESRPTVALHFIFHGDKIM